MFHTKLLENDSVGSMGLGSAGSDQPAVIADDINLLVIQDNSAKSKSQLLAPPLLQAENRSLKLAGRWQFRLGSDESLSTIPLPAKFGIGSDVLFEAN